VHADRAPTSRTDRHTVDRWRIPPGSFGPSRGVDVLSHEVHPEPLVGARATASAEVAATIHRQGYQGRIVVGSDLERF